MENQSTVPPHIVIGDTLIIEIAGGEYPAPDYSLELILLSPTGKLSVASTASADNHLLTVDTSSLTTGRYDYQLKVIGTNYRSTLRSGVTIARRDFGDTGLTTLDNRDWIDTAIEAIEASQAGRATKTQMSQAFDGVQIQHMTPMEQLDWLQRLYGMRNRRDAAKAKGKGRSTGKIIGVRF
jgi:hypothetical protein